MSRRPPAPQVRLIVPLPPSVAACGHHPWGCAHPRLRPLSWSRAFGAWRGGCSALRRAVGRRILWLHPSARDGMDLRRYGADAQLDVPRRERLRHCELQSLAIRYSHQSALRLLVRRRWAVGSPTGSRTTGAFGRIPVLDVFRARHTRWRRWGFRVGGAMGETPRVLCAGTWTNRMRSAPRRSAR